VEQLIVAESRTYCQLSEFHLGFRLGFGSLFARGASACNLTVLYWDYAVDWTGSRLKKNDFLDF